MKLINKIYQITIPIIIIIMILSSYIQYSELQERLNEEQKKQINFNIEKTLNLSQNALFITYFDHIDYHLKEEETLNKDAIELLFQSQFDINESYGKHLVQISLLNKDSQALISITKNKKDQAASNFKVDSNCIKGECKRVKSILTEQSHIVKVLLSDEKKELIEKNSIRGQLIVIYSLNNLNIETLQKNLIYQAVFYNIILFACLVGLIYVLAKMVVDPIKKLSKNIQNKNTLKAQNLNTNIQEINYLEKSFTKYSEKNKEQQDEIHKLNKIQAELLKTSNKKLYGLYQLSPLGIALCDMNGNFLEFNEAFEKICGYKTEELKQLTSWQLTPDTYHDAELEQYEILKETGFYGPYEKEYLQKNGNLIPINLNGMIIENEEGQKFVWSIVEDITIRKQTEHTLLSQSKMASMGEMIANIAHQWRQPLSIISTCATGMKMKKEFNELTDKEFIELCENINTNAQYLSNTIDDFRDFIKEDKIKKEFNLIDTIESFLHLIEAGTKNNNIQVITDIEKNIILHGNKNELIQCFINLFNNSKDAYLESNEEKFLFIKSYILKKNVLIEFKDNAGGISEEIIHKIFEPYFTTKHQAQGTGLGLSIVHNFITLGMSGSIEVSNITYEYNSKQFKGTKFKIILPLEE